MKRYRILFVILSTLSLAFIASIIPAQPVFAKCYNAQQQPIPCPKTKTPIPPPPTQASQEPTTNPNDTPTPADTPVNQPIPNPNDSPTPACPINVQTGPGNPGSGVPGTNPLSNPGGPFSGSFFDVFAIGGIFLGLLLGGFGGYRLGISRIREAAIKPDSTKAGGGVWTTPSAGSFFDDSPDATSPKIGPKHDDPSPPPESGSFFDDPSGLTSPKIGPKHDDPAPPPPDATPSPDVHPDVDADLATGADLNVNLDLPDST